MKNLKIYTLICTFILVGLFSNNSYAFPITESFTTVSSVSYSLMYLVASFFSIKYLLDRERFYKTTTVILLLCVLFLTSLLVYFKFEAYNSKYYYGATSILFDVQKRHSNPEIIDEKKSKEIDKFLKSLSSHETLDDYIKGNNKYNFIFVDDSSMKVDSNIFPHKKVVHRYKNKDELFSFIEDVVKNKNKEYLSNLKLVGYEHDNNRLVLAYEIFKRYGINLGIVTIPIKTAMNISSNANKERPNDKDFPQIIWEVYDMTKRYTDKHITIDNYGYVKNRHTVIDGDNYAVEDFWFMTDKELFDFFKKNKDVKFIMFDERNIFNLIKRVNEMGDDYIEFKKGFSPIVVKNFYYDNTLTPQYFNEERRVNSDFIFDQLKSRDDIKLLCFDKDFCQSNIPYNLYDYIDIGLYDEDVIENQINKLDKNKKYFAMVNNREEYGWALKIGYWMNTKDDMPSYLGLDSTPNTLSYLKREYHGKRFDKEFNPSQELTNAIKPFINDHNIVLYMILLGMILKFIFNRISDLIKKVSKNDLITSISVISLIISTVIYVDYLSSYYEVISFRWLGENKIDVYTKVMFIALFSLNAFLRSKNIILMLLIASFGVFLGYSSILNNVNILVILLCLGFEIYSLITIIFLKSFEKVNEKGVYFNYEDNKELPEKWRLVKGYNQKTEGVLINLKDIFKNQENIIKKYLKKSKNEKFILRSAEISLNENKLHGFFESYIVNKNEVIEKISVLRKSQSFVWLQELIDTDCFGVAKSVSDKTIDMSISIGKATDVTEGRAFSSDFFVNRCKVNDDFRKELIRKEILKIEKFYKSPVIVEFAIKDNKFIVLQIRIDKTLKANKITKYDFENYELAENYMVFSSLITGTILELISKGDFVWVNGYLYTNKKSKQNIFPVTEKSIKSLLNKVKEIENECFKNISHFKLLINIRKLLKLYEKLYIMTQSKYMNNKPFNFMNYDYSNGKNETEIANESKSLIDIYDKGMVDLTHVSTRDKLRTINLQIVCLLNKYISKYLNVQNIENININSLFDDIDTLTFKYDNYPLEKEIVEIKDIRFIVEGKLEGKLWFINNEFKLPTEEGKFILVGEEISSAWVRYLDKFSGIVTVYGGENSHLALSARELGIPYLKVDNLQNVQNKIDEANVS